MAKIKKTATAKKPVVLVILDGWGIRKDKRGNAISQAKLPNFNSYLRKFPHTELKAAEEAVGLVKGAIGNSEVGHINIGAGRIVSQDLVRINTAISTGSFFRNPVLLATAKLVKKKNSSLHLVGLVSDGKVHSDLPHLFALLKFAKMQKLKNVFVHAILDGRDAEPKSAEGYLLQLQAEIRNLGMGNVAKIATVLGRYYAMDRDKRWPRTEKAYNAMLGKGETAKSAISCLRSSYAKGISDEFVAPAVIGDFEGVKNNDAIFFFNFRSDRARQLSWAFVNKKFGYFKREKRDVFFAGMCEYDSTLDIPIAFKPEFHKNILGDVLASRNLKQLRAAETEKYAHVTYFFNNGREKPFDGEERILIPSPKVATYDKTPEMKAREITNAVVNEIGKDIFDFIAVNLANPDMVGHTGKLDAAIKAVEIVDANLKKIVDSALAKKGIVIVTADHGNCEEMVGKYRTSHTLNNVPLILIGGERSNSGKPGKKIRLRKGLLGDIAPTILELMGIKKPLEMTGKSLVV